MGLRFAHVDENFMMRISNTSSAIRESFWVVVIVEVNW